MVDVDGPDGMADVDEVLAAAPEDGEECTAAAAAAAAVSVMHSAADEIFTQHTLQLLGWNGSSRRPYVVLHCF